MSVTHVAVHAKPAWGQDMPKQTFCVSHCSKMHSGPAQCAADPNCFWSTLSQSCLQSCIGISDRRECGQPATLTLPDSVHCFWRNTTNRCEPRCSFLPAEDDGVGSSGAASECSKHLHCMTVPSTVSNTGAVATTRSSTNSSSTLSSSSSALTRTVRRCVPRCSDITHTVLDNLPLTQLPVEALRTTAELFVLCLAESDGECMYDHGAQLCVRTCSTQHGTCLAADEVAACNADARCRFDVARGHCTERCSAFGNSNEVACRAFHDYKRSAEAPFFFMAPTWVSSQCAWNARQRTCDEDCAANFPVDTSGATLASVAEACAKPFTGCFFSRFAHQRVSGAAEMVAGTCVPRCSRFSGDYAACRNESVAAYCAPTDSSASRCAFRCEVAFPRLDDDVVGAASSSSSALLSPQSGCEAETGVCEWDGGTRRCRNVCGIFSDDFHCSLLSTTETSAADRLITSLSSSSFSSSTACVFRVAGSAPASCMRREDHLPAMFVAGSSASTTATAAETATALAAACKLLAQHSCVATGACSWLGRSCAPRCSTAFLTQSDCTAAASSGGGGDMCVWISGSCVQRCDRIFVATTADKAQEFCASEPHCEPDVVLVAGTGARRVTCTYKCNALPGLVPSSSSSNAAAAAVATSASATAATCNSVAGCTMLDSRCVRACTSFAFSVVSQAEDDAIAQNSPDSVAADCLLHAPFCTDVFRPAFSSTATASATAAAASSSCTVNCAFAYATPSGCTADSNCFFSPRAGCLARCGRVTRKQSCASLAHCIAAGGVTKTVNGSTTPAVSPFRCYSICRIHVASTTCVEDAACVWTTASSSSLAAGVSSAATAGQCLQRCSLFADADECTAYGAADCTFDAEKQVCRTRCDKFSGGAESCAAYSEFCVWAGPASGCRDRCSLAPSESVCGGAAGAATGFSHCFVNTSVPKSNGTNARCVPGCETYSAAGKTACEAAALTGIDPSQPSYCVWTTLRVAAAAGGGATTTASFCTPDVCSMRSGDRQGCLSMSPICAWHAAAVNPLQRCAYSCAMRYPLAGSVGDGAAVTAAAVVEAFLCASDPACELATDPASSSTALSRSRCVESCSSLGSEECTSPAHASRCAWQSSVGGRGACVLVSCAVRNATFVAASGVNLTLPERRAVCIGSDSACFLPPSATTTGDPCVRACPALSYSAAACEAEPHCFFDHDTSPASNAGCLFKCSVLQLLSSSCPTTQAGIDAIVAATAAAAVITSSPAAAATIARSSYHARGGGGKLNLASHLPHFCDNIPSLGGCIESCFVKSQAQCTAAAAQCAFVTADESPSPLRGGCVYSSAHTCRGPNVFARSSACAPAHSLCKHYWGGQCGVDCSRFGTPSLCYLAGVAPECVWSASSNACVPSCYHLTTDLAACHANRNCFFRFATATCHDSCSVVHGTLPAPLDISPAADPQHAVSDSFPSVHGTRSTFCKPTASSSSTLSSSVGWSYCTYEADLDEAVETKSNNNDVASINSNSSHCTETCDARYTNNKALCEANSARCTWLAGGGASVCAPACSRFKSESGCVAQNHCFFDGDACVVKCAVAVAPGDRAACVAQKQCDFRFASAGCQMKCEAISCPRRCRATGGCRFDAFTGRCVLNCTAAFAMVSGSTWPIAQIQSDCESHASCVWDRAAKACRDHCSRALAELPSSATTTTTEKQQQEKCQRHDAFAAHCVWRSGRTVPCVATCAAMYDATTCATNTADCELQLSASGTSVCLDKCSLYSSSSSTATTVSAISACGMSSWSRSSSGCSLFSGGTVCARSCHLRAAATCASVSDAFCMPDPATAATTATCRVKCEAARSGQECLVSPRYAAQLAVERTLSADVSSSSSSSASSTATLPTIPPSSKTVVPAAHHVCEFFGGDLGSPRASRCVTACATAADATACAALSGNCTWRAGGCRPKCALLASLTACEGGVANRATTTAAGLSAGSSNSNSSSLTAATTTTVLLSAKENQLLLEGVGCAWNPFAGACEESCVFLHGGNKAACNANPRCVWSHASSSCVASCGRWESRIACGQAASLMLATAALSQCLWSDETSRCFASCSVRYGGGWLGASVDSAGCLADASCTLTSDRRCINACHLFATAALCRQHGTATDAAFRFCVWSSATSKCVFTASTENSSSTAACPSWAEPVTLVNATSKCAARCRLFRGDDAHGCSGDCVPVSAGVCVRDCFALYGTNRAACLGATAAATADPSSSYRSCAWDASLGRCQLDCAAITSSDFCNRYVGQCVWISNSCVQSCEARFGVAGSASTAAQQQHDCLTLAPAQCSATSRGGGVVCTDRCSLFSSSAALCATRSADCEWSTTINACMPRCGAFTAREQCVAGNAECDWLPRSSGGVGECIVKCAMYSSLGEQSCLGAATTTEFFSAPSDVCTWVLVPGADAGSCVRSCSVWFNAMNDFAGCDAEAHCSSRNRPTAAAFAATADPSRPVPAPIAIPPQLECLPSCTSFARQEPCNAASNCLWFGAQERCVAKCSQRVLASTDEMVRRMLMLSSSSSSATTTAAAFFCELDANCMYLASDNACENKCQYLDYTGCVQARGTGNRRANLCMWDSSASACRLSCAYAFGRSRAGCDSLSGLCAWSDGLGRCTTRCNTGAIGGASAHDCAVAVDNGASCRWQQPAVSWANSKITFSTYGWSEEVSLKYDDEGRLADYSPNAEKSVDERRRGQLRRALQGSFSPALDGFTAFPLETSLVQTKIEQACYNTSRLTLRVDPAERYDAHMLVLGAGRRLSFAQREAGGDATGILDVKVDSGAGGVSAAAAALMLVAVMLTLVIADSR